MHGAPSSNGDTRQRDEAGRMRTFCDYESEQARQRRRRRELTLRACNGGGSARARPRAVRRRSILGDVWERRAFSYRILAGLPVGRPKIDRDSLWRISSETRQSAKKAERSARRFLR